MPCESPVEGSGAPSPVRGSGPSCLKILKILSSFLSCREVKSLQLMFQMPTWTSSRAEVPSGDFHVL